MTARSRLLLVEDDTILGGAVLQRFQLEGLDVAWATSCAEAMRQISDAPFDFVLADIRLPDGSGETLFCQALPHLGETPIVFVTAFGEIEQAIRLVRAGADDYLTKPFDMDGLVKYIRKRVVARSAVAQQLEQNFALSPVTAALGEDLRRVADSDLSVLLLGETGAGKEVAARYLHRLSPRATRPFVAVNCGALTPDRLDSQFFGHVRGAFPGAIGDHLGFLGEADDGVLFLDEVAELAPQLQVALLRILEDGLFRPLGGQRDIAFRGRVIAATNADLHARVAERQFREDLYYRLAVVEFSVPPLRERRSEILILARAFFAQAVQQHGRDGLVLSPAAEAALHENDWPGNVRELRNRIERAVVLADGEEIAPGDLFPERRLEEPAPQNLKQTRLGAERRKIELALLESQGRIGEAAKRLGVSRTTLWKKLKQSEGQD